MYETAVHAPTPARKHRGPTLSELRRALKRRDLEFGYRVLARRPR